MKLRSRMQNEQGSSLREQIYQLLRQRIITGEIPPGGTIDDKVIAAELGVSRTPVREAVKKLSDEHLVIVIAQSGTRVSQIDPHEVRQAYLIRRALELESVAEAARNITPSHIDALQSILRAHTRAIENRAFVEAISIDDSFHRYIAQISNLARLWSTIEISKAELDRCRHRTLPRTGEGAVTLRQHADIITQLETGDPDAARAAMAHHLDSAYASAALMLRAEEAGSFAPFTKKAPRVAAR